MAPECRLQSEHTHCPTLTSFRTVTITSNYVLIGYCPAFGNEDSWNEQNMTGPHSYRSRAVKLKLRDCSISELQFIFNEIQIH